MAEGQVKSCQNAEQWESYFRMGKDSGNLVVVDFTASWCAPCRFITPILAELAKKYDNVLFLKVDVDELKSVAEYYKVDAMPTFVFLKKGLEIARMVGASKDKLLSLVETHAASNITETAATSSV